MHLLRFVAPTLLSATPLAGAVTYAFSHRPLADLSSFELSWALAVLIAIPAALACISVVALANLRLPPLRALAALALPALAALSTLILTGHYVLDHLAYQNSRYPAYLGYLASDLDRARPVLIVGAAATTVLSVVCYCLNLLSSPLLKRASWAIVTLLTATASFTLATPRDWTTELGSNWVLGVLGIGALWVVTLVLAVVAGRAPHRRTSAA
jgi:hypothetical protein